MGVIVGLIVGAMFGFLVAAVLSAEQPEWKKGEWCVTPDGMLVCSNCFENPTNRIIVNGSIIYDMTPIKKKMRFCPNCGARMSKGGKYDSV